MQNRKRHRCTEQIFKLCGRRWGWDVLREQHWNKYTIKGETITSPGWMHETSAQGWCTGKTQGMGWGGRREGGSGWGTYKNPWLIHFNVWQNPLQYCKVISLQLIKINGKKISWESDIISEWPFENVTTFKWCFGKFAGMVMHITVHTQINILSQQIYLGVFILNFVLLGLWLSDTPYQSVSQTTARILVFLTISF